MSINHQVPKLLPEHIVGHSADDRVSRGLGQGVRLPDLYQKLEGGALIRYRIMVDSSYLAQSEAFTELWCNGKGWSELARIYIDKEFYVVTGPPQQDEDPRSRETNRGLRSDNADRIAKSWQKIVNRLWDETRQVTDALGL